MSTHPSHDAELRLAEEASAWLAELLDDEARHNEAFLRWMQTSPRHTEEMLTVLAAAQAIAAITPEMRVRIEGMARTSEVIELPNNVLSLPTSPADRPVQQTTQSWLSLISVAAAVALVLGSWVTLQLLRDPVYLTDIGEQRVVELTDGSVIHLNTLSRLAVDFSATTRRVRLLEGQAIFKVAPDPARPFVVNTDGASIRALGTQFDVYRRKQETRVTVIEGAVQVASADAARGTVRVDAGEGVDVSRTALIKQTQIDVATVTAWRQGRLVFRETSLADIAAEFSRYNPQFSLKVSGAAARETFSGTFDADAPERLLQVLSADESLKVERVGEDIVIRMRD